MFFKGSSDAIISRDMNHLLHSLTFKHPESGEFAKIKHLISSDTYPNNNNYGYHYQTQSPSPQQLQLDENYEQTTQTVIKQEGNDDGGYGYNIIINGSRIRPNLVTRQKTTTPAGFLSPHNGYASMQKGSSSSTLNSHTTFSPPPSSSSSSSKFLPQIAENENELHDSTFHSLKRGRDGILNMSRRGEPRNHTPSLVHHMSLPKTSSEMAVVDNFLRFPQESTLPWRTRAKRGFATHPRSIAERVRRTKISERIKRLHELFPEIDKHCNTADMLDMAVEYIKNLQKELQTLSDARARCKCSSKQ